MVHEFAALCLCSLAQDFSSKVNIYEQDGLEPLIQCLNSHDPDVQKNAVETISLMLQVRGFSIVFSLYCHLGHLGGNWGSYNDGVYYLVTLKCV